MTWGGTQFSGSVHVYVTVLTLRVVPSTYCLHYLLKGVALSQQFKGENFGEYKM